MSGTESSVLADGWVVRTGAALLAAAGLAWLGGAVGAASGAAIVALALVAPGPFAVAVGTVGLAAVVPATPAGLPADLPLAAVGLAVAGLAGVLFGPDLRSAAGRRTAGLGVGVAGLLAGAGAAAQATWGATWVAAGVLALLVAVVGYGLHRYERVAVGMVPDVGPANGRPRRGPSHGRPRRGAGDE